MTLAAPKSPVAGSPERLKATAPTMLGLCEGASAFMTARAASPLRVALSGTVKLEPCNYSRAALSSARRCLYIPIDAFVCPRNDSTQREFMPKEIQGDKS